MGHQSTTVNAAVQSGITVREKFQISRWGIRFPAAFRERITMQHVANCNDLCKRSKHTIILVIAITLTANDF